MEKTEGFVFTEMEIQVLTSMMGKTRIYGFGQKSKIDGEELKKNTYEAIYTLAQKKYIEYVNKSNKISCPNGALPLNFDSLCVKERIVKLFRNIIRGKQILDITKWDNMENYLMYIGEKNIPNITIVRPSITNKDDLIVCGINKEDWYQYMQDEGYVPNNSLKGLLAGTRGINGQSKKTLTIRIVDFYQLKEIKVVNIYEDLSIDINDGKKIVYSKNNLLKEIGMI